MQLHKDNERRRWYLDTQADDECVANALTALGEEPSLSTAADPRWLARTKQTGLPIVWLRYQC